jgi:hypothetical protein
MKTHTRLKAMTATLFGLLAMFVVHAQLHAQPLGVKAQIPFGFNAGSTAFAPGNFTVHQSGGTHGVLTIRSETRGAMLLAQGSGASRDHNRPRLVFRRYGNRYFLREIWLQEQGPYGLPETKEERQIAMESRKTASLVSTVTIDATAD